MSRGTEDTSRSVPAIAGGDPVKTTPYGTWDRYAGDELAQLKEVLEQGTLFYAHGRKVKALEERVARLTGSRYAIATSSGTASIHAAMIAAGISPGDEVIVTPITDMGSLVPILWQGAVPVFADVDPGSYVLDPVSVKACITERTRAVLAVHLAGNACDMDGLRSICDERGIALIEDCAQAWGCTYRGRSVGCIGNIGCFSLNEFKHISCGDGGVVVTDDDALAKRLRLATDKCYSREAGAATRNPTFLANNYRMTELQGAVALAQLEKLGDIVGKRRAWCEGLIKLLFDAPGITLPQPTSGCDHSWWFFMLRVQPDVLRVGADRFAEALAAENISAGAHYIGQCVYEYPVFVEHSAFQRGEHPFTRIEYGRGMCPVAESVLDTAVVLPINEAYTDADQVDVATAVTRVARWFARGN